MAPQLNSADERHLKRAIELSQRSLDKGGTPFGAVVVVQGQVAGEGTSSVVELRDPTAHAEVMALREAGSKLGRHLMEDGVMYASSEPCPMCLVACYWARLPRLVYGATSTDVAISGFEDVQFYRELAEASERRTLITSVQSEALRGQATEVLGAWVNQLPEPVEAKL
ncbi:nucleoside deaminase [Streptomyces uncialis]|uniref:nucleoside deaminase n=1 Tax=Streptomyces uncialis TaxID=1048205 RepID=UPI002E2F5CD8|nr:nucleoside deaminase [Streptomyces uncialis]